MTTLDYKKAAMELRDTRMDLAWPGWLVQRMIDREGNGGSVKLPACVVIITEPLRVPQTFTINAPNSEFRVELHGDHISMRGVTFTSTPPHGWPH